MAAPAASLILAATFALAQTPPANSPVNTPVKTEETLELPNLPPMGTTSF